MYRFTYETVIIIMYTLTYETIIIIIMYRFTCETIIIIIMDRLTYATIIIIMYRLTYATLIIITNNKSLCCFNNKLLQRHRFHNSRFRILLDRLESLVNSPKRGDLHAAKHRYFPSAHQRGCVVRKECKFCQNVLRALHLTRHKHSTM